MPSLPATGRYDLMLESEYIQEDCEPVNSPVPPMSEDWDEGTDTYNAEDPMEPMGVPDLGEEEYITTITFGLFERPWDGFIEHKSHPLAQLMPGLFDTDRVTLSSSQRQISSMGDDDPHGLCEEALEEATHILSMRAARVLAAEREDDSPKRLHALRAKWFDACADLMGPIPLELPPLREINHEINLIDEKATYNFHMPRCPEALRPKLREKIQ
ncbi:hypothetical protein B0H11DRAFT_2225299 [Mycena galericulata]|nr:hypothetical protein B0H11DRAFT_2225299 [Mycena galericulata]